MGINAANADVCRTQNKTIDSDCCREQANIDPSQNIIKTVSEKKLTFTALFGLDIKTNRPNVVFPISAIEITI